MDTVADFEITRIDLDLRRHLGGDAVHVDRGDAVLQGAATDAHTHRNPDCEQRHAGRVLFVSIDPQKVYVHDVPMHLVVLDLAHDGTFVLVAALLGEHEDGVAPASGEGPLQRAGNDLESMGLLLMPVDDTGEHALLAAQSAHGALAAFGPRLQGQLLGFALVNLDRHRHWNTSLLRQLAARRGLEPR